jgi:hypothetical protein
MGATVCFLLPHVERGFFSWSCSSRFLARCFLAPTNIATPAIDTTIGMAATSKSSSKISITRATDSPNANAPTRNSRYRKDDPRVPRRSSRNSERDVPVGTKAHGAIYRLA